jgi:glycosyltransferase involved in cell wall biosynthesis
MDLVRRSRDTCESAVCCLEAEGAWAPELTGEGVPVTALHRQPGFHPGLGARLAAVASAFGADVLHCHQYSAFVYGRIGAAIARTGLVFTEHGRLGDHAPSRKRRLVNPILGRVSGGPIFSVSHHLRQHMIAEGFPAARVGVIHNGIDPGPEPTADARVRARQTLGLRADDLVIGTAARLDPVKDFTTLLTAFREVRDAVPAAKLVILGDGPERDHLTAARAALGLDADVTLAGHRADVRELLPGFDVFVNSSTSEGISLTILEGMAAALPVVATRVGGTPEIIEEGRTGALVRPRDPKELAGLLLALLGDPTARAVLGRRGRTRVLAHFTIERMVAEYVAQYARAAGRH